MWNKASERKLRLFAVACARRALDLFPADIDLEILDVAMLMADGRVTEQDLTFTRARARGRSGLVSLLGPAAVAADEVAESAAAARAGRRDSRTYTAERVAQTELLREVFGNPVRPALVDPSWLEWGGQVVRALAQGIYEDRTFQRIPVLADALEDAGCSDHPIIVHLRGNGTHFRGCWVIDTLTGRT
jgi:hypothetical protein